MTRTLAPSRVPRRLRLAGAALAATVALAACGTDAPMAGHHRDAGGSSASQEAGAGMPGHGMSIATDEADYLLMMVPHHREAIEASAHLTRSAHPELRRLGRTIRRTQSQEVRMMERWLDRWYPNATPSENYQPMMSDLSGLSGEDLDRTFLVEMVHHHMMAVMMSRHLQKSDAVRHRAVAALAASVIEDQSAEVRLMRQWLRQWNLD